MKERARLEPMYALDVADRSELEALRTQVANQAATLAEAVTDGFEDFQMGAAGWTVELTTPEGPSTGGGTQALQHIRLKPRRKGYATVVAGSVNPVTSTGELRTYEHVAMLHELRFEKPLEITPEEYAEFLKKADVILNLARIRATRSPPPPELLAHHAARRKLSTPMLVIFVVVVMLAAFVVYKVARTL
jgi:hypothetical protein